MRFQSLILVAVLILVPVSLTLSAPGAERIVTTQLDSGAGSLRQALRDAKTGDRITFSPAVFPPSNPKTITLLSALPELTQGNLTIDASNAGVILDGRYTPTWADGITIKSDGNVIKGLQIMRFPSDAIELTNGAKFNVIGGDWQVGAASHGEGNILTLNGESGVDINGSDTMSNTIQGNLIGLDADGTEDIRIQVMAPSPNYRVDRTLFMATRYHGVWKSSDGGTAWKPENSGLTRLNVLSLALSPAYASDRTLFAGTADGGIFRSTNAGASWVQVDTGTLSKDVIDLAISPGYAQDRHIFAGIEGEGVFKSSDGGSTWTAVDDGISDLVIHALAISPGYATDHTLFALAWDRVFKSTDQGLHWTVSGGELRDGLRTMSISPDYAQDQTLFLGRFDCDQTDMIWKSTDGGVRWESLGIDPGWCYARSLIIAPDVSGHFTLMAGDDWRGVFRSNDGGSTWQKVHSGRFEWGIAFSPAFAQDRTILVGGKTGRVFKSVDGGDTWQESATNLTEQGNSNSGVHISAGAHHNLIGGNQVGARNVISKNGVEGVVIEQTDTDYNTVIGNYLGTDASGTKPLGNGAEGVMVKNGAKYNDVGGVTAAEGNVISANGAGGAVVYGSGAEGNVISGNLLGLDVTGQHALGNFYDGVHVGTGANNNRVGGTTPGERNVVSGNNESGVAMWTNVAHNVVIGNYIGTDVSGLLPVGNRFQGVILGLGAQYNRIGGATASERNVIGGSGSSGVGIWEPGTGHNRVLGNYIGVGADGNTVISNREAGVLLSSGTQANEIGGEQPGEGNVIAGNGQAGVQLAGSETLDNVIFGNTIGLAADGITIQGNLWGISCWEGAKQNRVQDNLISGNRSNGVHLNSCSQNTMVDNIIGTDRTGTIDLGNGENGISLFHGAQSNAIGPGNTIAYNRGRGIGIWDPGSVSNTITRNAIYGNSLGGIDTGEDGNGELSPPAVVSLTDTTAVGLAPVASAKVELFSDEAGEGRVYEGTATADSEGRFTFTSVAGFEGPNVTATATDPEGNTSEFSRPVARQVPVGGDAYEPDNVCERARGLLPDGTSQWHTFHQQGDADWAIVNMVAGATYLIEAMTPVDSLADVALELYDQCQGLPAEQQDLTFAPAVRLRYRAAVGGPVYLKLVNHSPSVFGEKISYELSVRMLSSAPEPGVLVLVAGRYEKVDSLQGNINSAAQSIHRLFLQHGYTEERIYFLTSTSGVPGSDAVTTQQNLEYAITKWARDRVGAGRPFTLYMVDHGNYDRFYLDFPNTQIVLPSQLDGWLSSLEQASPATKVNVIIDACYSGSFIDDSQHTYGRQTVSKPGRVVITSTSATESAWASKSGTVFSDHFGSALDRGQSLLSGFQEASGVAQHVNSLQVPWLDDDGDSIANESTDGREAARRGFTSEDALNSNWPPYVVQASVSITTELGQGEIRAQVVDDTAVARVWAVVYPPSYIPPSSPDKIVIDPLDSIDLVLQGDDWYRSPKVDLDEAGTYRVIVYAEDYAGAEARPFSVMIDAGRPVFLPLLLR